MTRQLRDINISYNNLDFSREGSREYELSELVLEHLDTLFGDGIILNHFNASGMNLPQDKIKRLCESISKNKMLMSIHLNDNDITSDFNFMLEILDVFGIQQGDLPPQRNSVDDQLPLSQVDPLQRTDVRYDFRPLIQKYMLFKDKALTVEDLRARQGLS